MKTRTIRHQDGRVEIIRLLDREDVNAVSAADPLSYESSIFWLESIKTLEYVRVMFVPTCQSRRGPLNVTGGGRVVGYSTLLPDAPADSKTGRFTRRVFYLRDSDTQHLANGQKRALKSAADPTTILPGEKGRPITVSTGTPAKAAADTDSGQYIITLRGSSAVIDWFADADVSELRQRLDDDWKQAAVDTILESGPILAELVPVEGGSPIPLRQERINLGRMEECHVVLRFRNVSGLHCELSVNHGYWYVCDMNSTNGVKINGRRTSPMTPTRLDPGAVLSIANHQFAIRYEPVELGAVGLPPAETIE